MSLEATCQAVPVAADAPVQAVVVTASPMKRLP
jgi:hypothetical protein